jgi:hypothetical protein
MTSIELKDVLSVVNITEKSILVIKSDNVDIETLNRLRTTLSSHFGFKVPVMCVSSSEDVEVKEAE